MSEVIISGGRACVNVGHVFDGGGYATVNVRCSAECRLRPDDADALAATLREAARQARRMDREKRASLRRGER